MKFARLFTTLASFLLFCETGFAKDTAALTVQPVAQGIYMLSGRGGNIGLMVGEDGTFLIDDQFSPATPQILAAIESVGGTSPRFLINTHFHGDHTGGNENFGDAGALVMAHENVRNRLKNGYQVAAFNKEAGPAPKSALPVVTFDEGLSLHLNGEQIRAIHVDNAHTDGDSFIQFQSLNVVHAGDILFNGFFPFVDGPNGGRLKGMITAVNRILEIADENTRIIPGHGPLANLEDLKAYRAMLETAFQRLSKLRDQRLTLEQVIARKPLADLDPIWGKGIFTADQWIAVVYETL